MQEIWKLILDAPEYQVSSEGRVATIKSNLLNPFANNRGIITVNMKVGEIYTTRSVAVLVAREFVTPPDPRCNTVIHRDADRSNCSADNLRWLPRPLATRYHEQFKFESFWLHHKGVVNLDTEEVFQNCREAAIAYGLLANQIVVACAMRQPIYPTGHYWRFVSD